MNGCVGCEDCSSMKSSGESPNANHLPIQPTQPSPKSPHNPSITISFPPTSPPKPRVIARFPLSSRSPHEIYERPAVTVWCDSVQTLGAFCETTSHPLERTCCLLRNQLVCVARQCSLLPRDDRRVMCRAEQMHGARMCSGRTFDEKTWGVEGKEQLGPGV
ncbi:hypothetical protein CC86DRAFT_21137 [Ophiobolus disseminans]|uniref:Uncharacterized protein n=1 Tax=Ophiobolus disseminans TaxID=1469910 RepID=A0A6A7A1T7_9PLEO|nr:hypothetical protein CC86DRAFT_21137 [Ophiobolus disseminans]